MSEAVLILGNQLNLSLSSLQAAGHDAEIFMAEVADEAGYVGHHQQKIVLVFSAMRHFAEKLKAQGRKVHYLAYGQQVGVTGLDDVLSHIADTKAPHEIFVAEPGEYRLDKVLRRWAAPSGTSLVITPDTGFIATHETFAKWADGRKQLRMEYFYRDLRRQTGILMQDGEPIGGQWNYDADNRKKLPANHIVPKRPRREPDAITKAVIDLVTARFSNHFGELENFAWPVTREEAEADFEYFLDNCLPMFGDYQDAMKSGETFVYHSLVGASINLGLLDPLEVCRAAEARLHAHQAPINAVEGFIRQILGWREFIRGVYWMKMPDYAETNYFEAERALPDFYYTGETQMACLRAAIEATREHAYAHHIQRLMITGNFALLAGIAPEAVNKWYLEVYADAYEWVQLPNTHGMALFADGGVVGSKPYAASGAYVNRMSDYCRSCAYKVKEPTGDTACPFNYLYWDFITRHRDKLGSNPRMGMVYRTYDKMNDDRRTAIADSAAKVLENL
ncbi:MAG: cryptochrome/photolyase family protein [Pseudomonadota bacterium]|nr:cryptochrome/photolyase family protein [Pseudomonadota bacterium]